MLEALKQGGRQTSSASIVSRLREERNHRRGRMLLDGMDKDLGHGHAPAEADIDVRAGGARSLVIVAAELIPAVGQFEIGRAHV